MTSNDEILELIQRWNTWARQRLGEGKARANEIRIPSQQALALIGVRRSGKTYQAILKAREIDPENFLYINFEDPLFLAHSEVKLLDLIYETYVTQIGKRPKVVVFDELQNIPGWERWARKFIDLGQTQLIITGSSAKMLSRELSTAIAGRAITKVIWPLSFTEYLNFLKASPTTFEEFQFHINRYLQYGAFPQIVLENDVSLKEDLLRQYYSDIVLRDIVTRHQIRNAHTLDVMLTYCMTNISSLHSANSIRRALELSTETVQDYISFAAEAFLVFEVLRFHRNLKVQSRDPKKIYCIDTGLRNVRSASFSSDRGKLMENVVFLQLKRKFEKVFYFKDTYECDFILVEKNQPVGAVQVTDSDLETDELHQREIQGLVNAMSKSGLTEGTIITRRREDEWSEQGYKIHLKPLYKWLRE